MDIRDGDETDIVALLCLVELLSNRTTLGATEAQVLFRSEDIEIGLGHANDEKLLLGLVGSLGCIHTMHRFLEIHPACTVVDRLADVQGDPVARECLATVGKGVCVRSDIVGRTSEIELREQ